MAHALRAERINQRDDVVGLRLNGIKMFENLEFVRSFADFFRDEFLARLRWSMHSKNVRWHLGVERQGGV